MRKFLSTLMAYLSIAALLLNIAGPSPAMAQAKEGSIGAETQAGAEAQAPTSASPVPPGYLTGPNPGTPEEIARAYLQAHKTAYGLSDLDIGDLYVSDQYTDAHNGLTHV